LHEGSLATTAKHRALWQQLPNISIYKK
jgi:hypothetical protein